MLQIPPTWMPNVSLDSDRLSQAVTFYQWTHAGGTFGWVEQDDLTVVGTYLTHHQTVFYWDVILAGGVRGYSLFLHEAVELQWYAERNVNPFDASQQIGPYSEAHSLALLVEHRFLQGVARAMGHDFSLRELIVCNPHGDPPQRDWNDVWTHRQRELSPADADFNSSHEPQVQQFYQRLGF
jgi:hypothetical protein